MRSVSGGSHAEQDTGIGVSMILEPALTEIEIALRKEENPSENVQWAIERINQLQEKLENGSHPYQSERDTCSCEQQRIEVYPDDKFVYCQSKIECEQQSFGSDGLTIWCNKPLGNQKERDKVLDELIKWIVDTYDFPEVNDWLLDEIYNKIKELHSDQFKAELRQQAGSP
jgi:hypothetical protein